ncbi:phospholipase A2 inhibitor and Ly6/PLAUR domain-containing protein-like [Bufo gargarizans]|uniref:phospholipase A2 inhibitor and Ly6/PLAUR domain-containing protein-like n=1 Tax=Bufo gargarizans TaxID=30331 RepID=UPI001CF275B7|nr:phospholipase A2 inhibitor and Ly6/PLAUR domain-containing protein-like [Bufo gargarizans]
MPWSAARDTLSISAMGCASKNVCKGNGFLSVLAKPKSLEEIKCTNVTNAEPLRTGHFLWCFFCHDYNVKNCSDQAYLCSPEQDVCVFERTRSIYNRREEVEITKRCGKSIECSRAGSIRSSTKTIYMNTTCCDYNVCQAPIPDLPSASIEENGLTCPTCFVPNSDRCLGRSGLKCSGNEQRCIHYMKTEVQEISTVTESLHGCTTNEICEAGSGMYPPVGRYHKSTKIEVMCSRAVGWSAPLCTVLLSVTVIVLALVRPS